MKQCLRTMLAAVAVGASVTASAQMTGTDVFLHGKYVEAGISTVGNFGSGGSAPAGYHSHMFGAVTNISLVADPDGTGWDTTTAGTHYWGDFFLPGFPFEGWTLQLDTVRCMGSDAGVMTPTTFALSPGMPACSGANVSYSATGSVVTGTWQGLIDSVQLTQVTSLDTNDKFLTVRVTLTNLATAPKDNIYYYRAADPDNDLTWYGGPTTENTIEHQAPNPTHSSVVSARGHLSGSSYIALGSGDSASRAVVVTTLYLPITQDLGDVYSTFAGTALHVEGDSNYADNGIGIIIKVPHLATVDSMTDSVAAKPTSVTAMRPANSATFKFFYAFSPSAVPAAIAATRPDTVAAPIALGVINANKTADIAVYPNPAKDNINISGLSETDHVTVYDLMGRATGIEWQAAATGTNTFPLHLAAGNYVLVINNAAGNAKARLPLTIR